MGLGALWGLGDVGDFGITCFASPKAVAEKIVWCLPFGEPHGFAGCKACSDKVEPDSRRDGATIRPRDYRFRVAKADWSVPLREPR